MQPEMIIKVRFLTEEEGGRKSSIRDDKYGCTVLVGDEGFDCRFVIDGSALFETGKSYQIAISFLSTNLAMERLSKGDAIKLWEGKVIAEGTVERLL